MQTATEVYTKSFYNGLRPDPELTVSEWSDNFRWLPQKSSGEPGPWRTSRTPYLKEIMDCLSPSSPVEKTVFMKGSQLGGTEGGNNWIGYVIHKAPCPMLVVQPTVEVAKRMSKQRLAPTIEETPVLKALVKDPRSRDSGNTMMIKEFKGGVLILTGANSAVGLRSMPVKYLFLDEVDGYPADVEGEGDPCSLAEKRTSNFARRKIFKVSTPTEKGVSRIEADYELSDQRKYYVPCLACSEMQTLEWGGPDANFGITFEKDEKYRIVGDVTYKCKHCGELISEHHKTKMLADGEWRKHNPESRIAGFHLSALYSPLGWKSWKEIVEEFLESKRLGDKNKLKTWVNTVLGETWEESGEKIDHSGLYARREGYGPQVSVGGLILTCAVDVQDDRVEAEVKAWGKDEESWGVEHKTIYGSPSEDTVWNDLDKFLQKTYQHDTGIQLHIACTCIDSGAHTKRVYDFVKDKEVRRIYAVKGMSTPGKPIVGRPTTSNLGRVKLFPVGSDTAKSLIYGRLKIENPGPGYMHFSSRTDAGYDEEYFRQLTSEKLVTRHSKGHPVKEWKLPGGRKNEALDLTVYNQAAISILRPDWEQLDIAPSTPSYRQVFHTYRPQNQDDTIKINEGLPLVVCIGFDDPSVWLVAQRISEIKRVGTVKKQFSKIKVLDEIVLRGATTASMAKEFNKRYGGHKGGVIVYASEIDRSESALLKELGFTNQQIIRRPIPDKDRVNAVNTMLCNTSGEVNLTLHPNCIMLRKDLELTTWGENGEIDKTGGRGYATDVLSHFIAYEFPLRNLRPNPNKRFFK